MGFRVPSLAALRARTLDDVNRWMTQAVAALQPVFELGTTRIQSYDVPAPIPANDGQAIVWDKATSQFKYVSLTTIPIPLPVPQGGTGDPTLLAEALLVGNGAGPIQTTPAPSSAGQVPQWNGSAWVMTTVTSVPAPTRRGQILACEDNSTYSVIGYDNILDIPPSSPSANDDEFEAATLNGIWTPDAGVSSGTVDLNTNVGSGAIYDLTSAPGTLKLQPFITGGFLGISQDVSTLYAANDVTVWAKLMVGYAGGPNLPQMDVFITDNAGTAFVRIGIEQFVSANRVGVLCFDSSPTNSGFQINTTNGFVVMPVYVALRRVKTGGSVAWTAAASIGGYSWTRLSAPGTPVSTLTFTPKFCAIRMNIASGTTAVGGCAFIRFNTDTRWPGGG